MARGDVMIHARDGMPLAEGVGLDAEGRPATDPAEVLKGAQLPFGGYKGSSIALMIELLVGALIGDLFSYESGERDNGDGGPPAGGELILALDPDRFGDRDGWRDHTEAFFARLLQQPGVRLPGDRRRRMRETTARAGITIPAPLAAEIKRLL
jgi:delta1-piperideine-2-carboxylate reductase